eukprot:2403973-Amphidinium_carterae.1
MPKRSNCNPNLYLSGKLLRATDADSNGWGLEDALSLEFCFEQIQKAAVLVIVQNCLDPAVAKPGVLGRLSLKTGE